MDLLDTEGEPRPRRTGRAVVAAVLVVGTGLGAAVARDHDDAGTDGPVLRLAVGEFTSSGSAARVEYTVTNDGPQPVRLVDIRVEDDAARVTSVRVPAGQIGVGKSVGATVDVRFSCASAQTRPVRPGLRLTALTPDGHRHVVPPAPGSSLALGAGGGSLLTGPATAPCSACLDVLDALAPVDAATDAADRRTAARAGGRVVVLGVVERAQRVVRAARSDVPADQAPVVDELGRALDGIAATDAPPPQAFARLQQLRDDLDDRCDPAVPEVLR